jgi:molecular chaperone GrpE
MKLVKAIEQLEQSARDITKEKLESLAEIEAQLDYAQLLARTGDEYHEWGEDIEQLGKVIETSEHLGAQTLFVELNKPVETSDGLLRYVQLTEPVSNKIYPKYGLAAVVYGAREWHQVADILKQKKIHFTELPKQGDVELVELKFAELSLIFRSQFLSKEILNRNKPLTDSEKINQLKNEVSELKEKVNELELERAAKLQIMADFQNFRKRVEKERASFGLIANMGIVNEVMDVVDDVKRTIDDEEKDVARAQQMLKIINDKLLSIVQGVGIEQVPIKTGDNFSPEIMEAVGTVSVAEVDDHNKVMSVIQPGYKYTDKDQIMRAAKVIVGKKDTGR